MPLFKVKKILLEGTKLIMISLVGWSPLREERGRGNGYIVVAGKKKRTVLIVKIILDVSMRLARLTLGQQFLLALYLW